jgi:hypothetical protein
VEVVLLLRDAAAAPVLPLAVTLLPPVLPLLPVTMLSPVRMR